MNEKLCVAIGCANLQDAVKAARDAVLTADVVEIRLDMIESPRVAPFFHMQQGELLFTNRASWEGGSYVGSEEQRTDMLIEAVSLGADYIDLELLAPRESREKVLAAVKETRTKLIVSLHNFKETPQQESLEEILTLLLESGADIGKIITMAEQPQDNLRLLSLLPKAKDLNFPLIAFAMGQVGVMSRVATTAFGGYMSYCSADGEQLTAPGQLGIGAMRQIYQLIHRGEKG